MKKVFILFSVMAGVVFTSCSKDDDNQTPEEALVGTWKISAEFDGFGEPYELTDCNDQNLVVFMSDNSYDYIDYDPVAENSSECVVDDNDSISGSWEITADGQLKTNYGSGGGELANFSIDGNELTIGYEYEENGQELEDKYVYKRQ